MKNKRNKNTPAMPDEEYIKATAEEDQEKLDDARKRLYNIIRLKCSSIGPSVIEEQIRPMVYAMNLSDCENMYEVISKRGIVGLASMLSIRKRRERK